MKGNPLSTHRWQKLRAHVIAQSSTCSICGGHLDPLVRWPDPQSTVVDHRESRARGGAVFDPANLAPAHKVCNERKGRGDMPAPPVPPTTRQW